MTPTLIPILRDLIRDRAAAALSAKGSPVEVPLFDLSVPPPRVPGDLAANVALMVAKQAGASPRALAESMLKDFPAHPFIAKAEIAGPGFLNFWISDEGFRAQLENLLTAGGPDTPSTQKQKLLIEFVSANPTGPLHVGHGRGAALGDSLVRIFRYLGHDVAAEFYVNDSGGQIRNLGLSVEARLKELNGETVPFPEDGYKGTYVKDIAAEIRDKGLKLKSVEPTQLIFTEEDYAGYASKKLLALIQTTLKEFGVEFDRWYPESNLHKEKRVLALIDKLREKKLAYENEGAVWFKATDYGDDKDRVLRKGNEAPTYFASDIAYHDLKFSGGWDRLVNIWGADHHGYAQRLKGAMKAFGLDADRLDVIFNQMVSIKGGKLSKRAGDIITLKELVDEVGRDATRFFFALRSPGAHFEFDLDLAKKQASDNPVFYVQYVHARCCSIFREAEKRGLNPDPLAWKSMSVTTPVAEEEKTVMLHLASFQKTVEVCAKDYSNHHLTVYLLELAGKYHSFYEKCQVLVDDPALRSFRLGIVDAIRRRVAEGLNLLGVSAPESL